MHATVTLSYLLCSSGHRRWRPYHFQRAGRCSLCAVSSTSSSPSLFSSSPPFTSRFGLLTAPPSIASRVCRYALLLRAESVGRIFNLSACVVAMRVQVGRDFERCLSLPRRHESCLLISLFGFLFSTYSRGMDRTPSCTHYLRASNHHSGHLSRIIASRLLLPVLPPIPTPSSPPARLPSGVRTDSVRASRMLRLGSQENKLHGLGMALQQGRATRHSARQAVRVCRRARGGWHARC